MAINEVAPINGVLPNHLFDKEFVGYFLYTIEREKSELWGNEKFLPFKTVFFEKSLEYCSQNSFRALAAMEMISVYMIYRTTQ